MHIFEVLRRPLVTEKSTIMQDGQNKYAFEVDSRANKSHFFRAIFGNHVLEPTLGGKRFPNL